MPYSSRAGLAVLMSLIILAGSGLAGCASLDVVGQYAVTSFGAVLQAADIRADDQSGGWSLSAPDQSARFFWSRDPGRSDPYDLLLAVDAQPFLAAGLDPTRLPSGLYKDGQLLIGRDLGSQAYPAEARKTSLDSFAELVREQRPLIGYHETLDHYGVDLGNGNKFEWAKDMARNDKDIVFVLDPAPLLAAGVDPAKVSGWVFAKVAMKDSRGQPIEADKFLKPFNLQ